MHNEVAHVMLSEANMLAVPWLQTRNMLQECRLAAVTRSDCKAMAHLRFLKRLWEMSEITPKSLVILCAEPGTSKTCSVCGTINIFLGGSKFNFCNSVRCGCGNDVSRDGQAAAENLVCEVLRGHGFGYVCHRCCVRRRASFSRRARQSYSLITPSQAGCAD